jgi:hypothetical protein
MHISLDWGILRMRRLCLRFVTQDQGSVQVPARQVQALSLGVN